MHAHARAQMQAQAQAASSARAHAEAEAAAASAAAAQAAAEAHFHESAMAASQFHYSESAAAAPEPTQAGYGEVAAPVQAPASGQLIQVGTAAQEPSQSGYDEAAALVQAPSSAHHSEVAAAAQVHYEAPVAAAAHAIADAADQGLQLNDHCGTFNRQEHHFARRFGNCHSAPACTAVDSSLLDVAKDCILGPVWVHLHAAQATSESCRRGIGQLFCFLFTSGTSCCLILHPNHVQENGSHTVLAAALHLPETDMASTRSLAS